MLFRKIVFGLLTVGLGLAALAFGLLFIICLSLLLLWHGLSTSVIMFGALTVACLVLAYKALRRTFARERGKRPIEPSLMFRRSASSHKAPFRRTGAERMERRNML